MGEYNGAPAKSNFPVLVIEDSPGDRRLIEITLKEGGRETGVSCKVLVAENLKQGMNLLRQEADHAPRAILLDLGLPGSVAFEALIALKSEKPDVPVIILAGQDDPYVSAGALKYGAADYLEKTEIRPRSLWRAIDYACERKKLEIELVERAVTDQLTGLKNRRALFEILEQSIEQARRSELHCAIFVIDIDEFKQVNDLLGHDAGDELLKRIAVCLSEALRRTDTVGRLGGDEFAVIAPNIKSPSGALEVAEKIRSAISSISSVKGKQVSPSASIGAAIFHCEDITAEELLSNADIALYKAKRAPSKSIQFYDENMHKNIMYRHCLKNSMISEVSTSNFYLEYQPIISSKAKNIVCAEALARWKDPQGKVIMPHEFIPIAEENGLISILGMQLIEQACDFISKSQKDGATVVPISINVSPIQCRDAGFPLHVTSMILKYGLDPRLINIEITESAIMQNIETARRSLKVLKDAGIGIYIDDFGTGYSSLSLLKDLPLDHLKIDRSFVSRIIEDAGTRHIIETISALSSRLQFKTVAEGVETEEQVRLLSNMGIDCLQGYYFSPPISASNLLEKLALGGTQAMSGQSAVLAS